MKKLVYLLVASAVVTGAVSCGAPKQVVYTPAPAAAPVAEAPAQVGDLVISLAEAEPVKRAWATATEMQQQAAITVATASARANIASAIQERVIQGVGSVYNSITAGSVDPNNLDEMAQSAMEFGAKANVDVMAISKENVASTVVIKTERHRLSNGMWEAYVCVEVNMSVAELTQAVSEKVFNVIPQAVKEEMGLEQYMFNESMKKAFEDYNSVTK